VRRRYKVLITVGIFLTIVIALGTWWWLSLLASFDKPMNWHD
jgi:cytoskeletal protein RodZ